VVDGGCGGLMSGGEGMDGNDGILNWFRSDEWRMKVWWWWRCVNGGCAEQSPPWSYAVTTCGSGLEHC
jgi:hypothetical protein